MKQQLILIRGVPGSGKSTLARILAPAIDADHFEADMYFYNKAGEYHWDGDLLKQAHLWCKDFTWVSLNKGRSVILSDTFLKLRDMRIYYKVAADFNILPSVILMQNDFGSLHMEDGHAKERAKARMASLDISTLHIEFKNLLDGSISKI